MSNKVWMIALCLGLGLSCAKESQLQLQLSANLAPFYPTEKSSLRFFSNNGDTLLLERSFNNQGYRSVEVNLGTGGALSALEKVEVEQRASVYRPSAGDLELSFNWQARYSQDRPNFSYDVFSVRLRDADADDVTQLQMEYRDSLLCVSNRCQWADTLRLLTGVYRNVYFTRRDSISKKALYLNRSKGLIGFRAANNQLFERIF